MPQATQFRRRRAGLIFYLGVAPDGVYTDPVCHHTSGELLPHLFTLTHTEMRAVVFCHLNPKVTPSFPLRSVMLYVARTFLSIFPAEARKHERQTTILFYRHKDNTFFRITDQTAPLSNQRGHIHLASRPTKVTMFFAKVKHTPPQVSNI